LHDKFFTYLAGSVSRHFRKLIEGFNKIIRRVKEIVNKDWISQWNDQILTSVNKNEDFSIINKTSSKQNVHKHSFIID
jgi:hypothetical protein